MSSWVYGWWGGAGRDGEGRRGGRVELKSGAGGVACRLEVPGCGHVQCMLQGYAAQRQAGGRRTCLSHGCSHADAPGAEQNS